MGQGERYVLLLRTYNTSAHTNLFILAYFMFFPVLFYSLTFFFEAGSQYVTLKPLPTYQVQELKACTMPGYFFFFLNFIYVYHVL